MKSLLDAPRLPPDVADVLRLPDRRPLRLAEAVPRLVSGRSRRRHATSGTRSRAFTTTRAGACRRAHRMTTAATLKAWMAIARSRTPRRRVEVSTSFMLSALRVLDVDTNEHRRTMAHRGTALTVSRSRSARRHSQRPSTPPAGPCCLDGMTLPFGGVGELGVAGPSELSLQAQGWPAFRRAPNAVSNLFDSGGWARGVHPSLSVFRAGLRTDTAAMARRGPWTRSAPVDDDGGQRCRSHEPSLRSWPGGLPAQRYAGSGSRRGLADKIVAARPRVSVGDPV